jgi:hypothetical protein
VQIRDEKMTLIAYFRLSQAEKGLKKNNLENNSDEILTLLEKLPFGKVFKFKK